MAITVKILKRSPDGRPTLYATRDFDVLPVSIGRDAACNICLEDPNKHMSRFHVEIEEESGVYWMAVVSKVNPVMAKGRRYGPGTRVTLNSGDSFEVAEYEVQVLLPEAAPAVEPRPALAVQAPLDDRLMQALGSTTTGGAPVADVAERLFNESTFLGGDQPTPAKLIPTGPEFTAPEETFVPNRVQSPPPAARAPAPAPSMADALRVFLEGAGVPHKDFSPAESERMLRDCGAILRAAVEGIMMLLIARAELRKEFESDARAMPAARDNNPLKRMSSAHEAMDFLFDPGERTDGLLDPVQAVSEACDELRTHQLALMAGMRAAIEAALRRLEPGAIERVFGSGPKGFSLASRKTRLWELFVVHQDKLSRDVQEDFKKVFGRDFIGAYHAEVKRVKGTR